MPLERARAALELARLAQAFVEDDMLPRETIRNLKEHLEILVAQLMPQPKRAG